MSPFRQPIASPPPSYEALQSARFPNVHPAELDTNEELDTKDEPPASPRQHLINHYWKVVFTPAVLLFIFPTARPATPTKLDEDSIPQMAHRMNNLAVPRPKVPPVNIYNNPLPNEETVATLDEFEKIPQEYLRQGHALYCSLMKLGTPWPNDFRYIYALPEDTVRYLLLDIDTSVLDAPVVAPIFERSKRIPLLGKERRRRLARIIERKLRNCISRRALM
ncbi:hypothetical protein Forpi1262_v011105 [Fusarium oxysporum f. sp. raphani]|uniref:Uncharacterized protein n=1 Tax=Fusarium oxysporum f. sp. raphani TaxID=96318 RepID=A0A8J5PT52_FUSOX|nr:hypothetical protein Forpi1262_v011105 [Fusarium oxysporum f. sp. raphani]